MGAGVAYRTPGAAYIIKKRYIPYARIYRGRLVVLVCTTERQFRGISNRACSFALTLTGALHSPRNFSPVDVKSLVFLLALLLVLYTLRETFSPVDELQKLQVKAIALKVSAME
jgi:hypothetical protein